jgi:hypothetical protein
MNRGKMNKKIKVDFNLDFAGLLTILFIGLKLAKIIDWSWWWVLSPIWILFVIGIVIGIIGGDK